MRVSSDKQTLILAGEAIPRRSGVLTASTSALKTITSYQQSLLRSGALSSSRGSSFNANAANEYVRTQQLSADGIRTAIIDTYA